MGEKLGKKLAHRFIEYETTILKRKKLGKKLGKKLAHRFIDYETTILMLGATTQYYASLRGLQL